LAHEPDALAGSRTSSCTRKQQDVYKGRPPDAFDDRRTATMDTIPDDSNHGFDAIWEREWKSNLTQMALSRVKAKALRR